MCQFPLRTRRADDVFDGLLDQLRRTLPQSVILGAECAEESAVGRHDVRGITCAHRTEDQLDGFVSGEFVEPFRDAERRA